MEQYQYTVKEHSNKASVVTTADDVDTYLINLAKTSLMQVKFQYLTAASALSNNSIYAWFNGQFYHTAPLALNLVHNAFMRAFYPDHTIHVKNAPMKYLPTVPTNGTSPEEISATFGFSFTMCISIVLSITSAIYINFYIKVT